LKVAWEKEKEGVGGGRVSKSEWGGGEKITFFTRETEKDSSFAALLKGSKGKGGRIPIRVFGGGREGEKLQKTRKKRNGVFLKKKGVEKENP